jgi:hypothetical protein
MDFLVVPVVLLPIYYFLALVVHSGGPKKSSGKGGPRDERVYDNDSGDTVWTRVFFQLLEALTREDRERVGGLYLFCSVFPPRFSRTAVYPPELFFFSSVNDLLVP